ncbi:CRN-like protein [Plasmopara halstedii]|uniref:CRN-like protein n=1 Tax=Plasmopara halstedii TaxID=4781 RepID=A0A0N7L4S8_PLAHL|nr:CRN-like protein [Plasmopara halstedii]CEG39515.1 CRN-like protein [Plasmopara halstedii]|eukprot:XP_024575884.1 CRN-like protein [Plasmopara halstedii]
MVTLFCAVVGVKGNAFSVDIDASQSVDHLKKAIKKKKNYDFAADKLELYLAKKGESWLTENEVKHRSDISGLKHLRAARARLHRIGLSDDQIVEEVDEIEEDAGNGSVNVLVVVPTEMKYALAANRRAASSIAISAAEPTEVFVTIEEIRDSERD